MFSALFQEIERWMKELLTGMVTSNLTNMFADVNSKTAEVASQVGQTPQGWNGSIFSMIRSLSNSVIIPIAGMIITFILCYELISMITRVTQPKSLIWSGSSAPLARTTLPKAKLPSPQHARNRHLHVLQVFREDVDCRLHRLPYL